MVGTGGARREAVTDAFEGLPLSELLDTGVECPQARALGSPQATLPRLATARRYSRARGTPYLGSSALRARACFLSVALRLVADLNALRVLIEQRHAQPHVAPRAPRALLPRASLSLYTLRSHGAVVTHLPAWASWDAYVEEFGEAVVYQRVLPCCQRVSKAGSYAASLH